MENPIHKTAYVNARNWRPIANGKVKCLNCPRSCSLGKDQSGVCAVRRNLEGKLVTDSYTSMLIPGYEPIETEGIFHFWPGCDCLMLGNAGCTLDCDWCQNWETARSTPANSDLFKRMTIDDIEDYVVITGVDMVSFTYNDFVAAPELMQDLLPRIKKHARALFKTAAYVNQDVFSDVLEHIDVLSFSLKTVDNKLFHRHCRGNVEIPLSNLKHACERRREHGSPHIEVSTLVVPEFNDNERQIERIVGWFLENVGQETPLHFVKFHPAHRYQHVQRTDTEVIERSCAIAEKAGVKYVYAGNVFFNDRSNTYCPKCKALLVRRQIVRGDMIELDGTICSKCGETSPIVINTQAQNLLANAVRPDKTNLNIHHLSHDQVGEMAHLVAHNSSSEPSRIWISENGFSSRAINIPSKSSLRIGVCLAKTGNIAFLPDNVEVQEFSVLDRAHYPTTR
ncbi:MAG: AmmeMemoRadiSam system radical SAM enzyme [Deltaproteobacteria bacterium]|nr:AmmeMemoRadiSam system radical SAM enzyme [Deltaproteobacteria bacterium]